MKEEENITEKPMNTSPYKERMCLCGCKSMFIPRRRDQFHLNSNHTNNAYNNGKRKRSSKNQVAAEKQLRKNDKLLEKYHNFFKKVEAVVASVTLRAEGFDHCFFIGNEIHNENLYYKTYNYQFREYEFNGMKLTKILRPKKKIYAKH